MSLCWELRLSLLPRENPKTSYIFFVFVYPFFCLGGGKGLVPMLFLYTRTATLFLPLSRPPEKKRGQKHGPALRRRGPRKASRAGAPQPPKKNRNPGPRRREGAAQGNPKLCAGRTVYVTNKVPQRTVPFFYFVFWLGGSVPLLN